jgi:hypothetical protein
MSPWSAMVQRVVRDALRAFPRISAGVSPWSAMVRTKNQIRAREMRKWRGWKYYKATMLWSADHYGPTPLG